MFPDYLSLSYDYAMTDLLRKNRPYRELTKAYTTQRNYCVNLLRKTRREYFANMKINHIVDIRKFWQTVKLLFSDKINHRDTINLIGNRIT